MGSGDVGLKRTTQLMGEIIAHTSEQEDLLTRIGKEGLAYWRAGLFSYYATLELCERVAGNVNEAERSHEELEMQLEGALQSQEAQSKLDKVKRKANYHVGKVLLRREMSAHDKVVRDQYDELGKHIVALSQNHPKDLSVRMLRMCEAFASLKDDTKRLWDEFERLNAQSQKTVFAQSVNMFMGSFMRFSNQEWVRGWYANLASLNSNLATLKQTFQARIHQEVERRLAGTVSAIPEEEREEIPVVTPAPPAAAAEPVVEPPPPVEEPPPEPAVRRKLEPPKPKSASVPREFIDEQQ